MSAVELIIKYRLYEQSNLLETDSEELLNSAYEAAIQAYAPYSNFAVGCALLLSDGTTIGSCNQENASFPCGICAERAALYQFGNMRSDRKIIQMAVSTLKALNTGSLPASPCGFCRQVMVEFEKQNGQPYEVIIGQPDKKCIVFNSASDLLPLYFHADFLS